MVKRAIVRRFPVIMMADETVKAQHHTIASRLDRTVFNGASADDALFERFFISDFSPVFTKFAPYFSEPALWSPVMT